MRGSYYDLKQADYSIILSNSKLVVDAGESHTLIEKLKVKGEGSATLVVGDLVHIANLRLDDLTNVHIAKGWQIGNHTATVRYGTELRKQG